MGESVTWRLIQRKARPWFDSQKAVVKLCLNQSSKQVTNSSPQELSSIASWSLTVTDSQPNKTHFDTTQPRLNKNPSQISTNHVRVHTAHDHEHSCYNSFTLCRGCTRSPWVMIILEKPNTRCTEEHSYTLPKCVLGKSLQCCSMVSSSL
jgi:hypothetical protein